MNLKQLGMLERSLFSGRLAAQNIGMTEIAYWLGHVFIELTAYKN